ncbi:MAG: glutamate formiminotransferase/formiminotetrahydrofolate cyclodeaminase [Sphingobacteriales bacterium]|jgi:glutamate formiminotransferase/formiminotetrahydrofolate cyclodeaminase
MKRLIECVPNFSEGRDMSIIKQITDVIESVDGVKLLDVDPGKATNRTVVTFVGEPEPVIEAAFLAIKKAGELIDMSKHSGEHPRFGATDVCPLVPISNITMDEVVPYAHKLGARVGKEIGIPIYFYENAAKEPKRQNLASCRAGEYEALPKKLSNPDWKADEGAKEFNDLVKRTGATAISARDFLVAYNVNLNTTSARRANSIAFDIREAGRVQREGNPITGKILEDKDGNSVRIPGKLKCVKGIGWYIEEYGVAQISYNLTNISITPVHIAFDESCKSAIDRGLRVTGSELVGLIPLKAMLDAADYFLEKQQRSLGISESEKINIAIKSLGLDDLKPFDPSKRIIEYVIKGEEASALIDLTVKEFANQTASESPAPGGGSVSAYMGALGASLGAMVANLSSHKRGWDDKWEFFSDWAVKAQTLKDRLLYLVDEDTNSFNKVMEAFRLPKGSDSEVAARKEAIEDATKYAIQIPFEVMETSFACFEMLKEMANSGLKASVSDAGVGALCCTAAIKGAFLNVKINAGGLKDKDFVSKHIKAGEEMLQKAISHEAEIMEMVEGKI